MSLFKDSPLHLRKKKQKYLEGLQDHGLHPVGSFFPVVTVFYSSRPKTMASTFSPETHYGVMTLLEPRQGGHTGDSLNLNGHNDLAHLEDDEP